MDGVIYNRPSLVPVRSNDTKFPLDVFLVTWCILMRGFPSQSGVPYFSPSNSDRRLQQVAW